VTNIRLREVDEIAREDHSFITPEDKCLYLYEFTKGGGFAGDNQLIANLKKKPATSNHYELQYKRAAIRNTANTLINALNPIFISSATFVPVPPSKATNDPAYDNRMTQVCRSLGAEVDVRELVTQSISMEASHERGAKPRIQVADLLSIYSIDESIAADAPQTVAVVDDVLTTGTHFKAMQQVLSGRFPKARIFGIFIARRVFATPEF
jgi:predicted amidophosphoribosyltransferase